MGSGPITGGITQVPHWAVAFLDLFSVSNLSLKQMCCYHGYGGFLKTGALPMEFPPCTLSSVTGSGHVKFFFYFYMMKQQIFYLQNR